MEFLSAALIVVSLLFISAFFSAGELALMALDRLHIETEVRRGSRLALLQRRLRAHPQRFLSTILIGYNVANITLATYGAALSLHHLQPLLGESRALVLSTVVLTLLILVFGELMPKTVAAISTVRIAALVTYPLYLADLVLLPINWLLEKGVMPLIYVFTGGRRMSERTYGREDVATALVLAHRGGQLHASDAHFAGEALKFSSRNLEDVMTPRVDIVAVSADATVGPSLQAMIDSGFSRLPVYHGDLDTITGVLFLKDLMRFSLRHLDGGREPQELWAQAPITPLLRAVTVFPSTKSIVEALAEIRLQRLHLAVVVDEHGGTAGIVTLEDIIEELVGDITDETDHAQSGDVVLRTASFALVNGRARLDQLPELEGVDLGAAEANTLGGLMLERLGRPAVVGDTLEYAGVRITALKVLRTRVKLLRVERFNTDLETTDAASG